MWSCSMCITSMCMYVLHMCGHAPEKITCCLGASPRHKSGQVSSWTGCGASVHCSMQQYIITWAAELALMPLSSKKSKQPGVLPQTSSICIFSDFHSGSYWFNSVQLYLYSAYLTYEPMGVAECSPQHFWTITSVSCTKCESETLIYEDNSTPVLNLPFLVF